MKTPRNLILPALAAGLGGCILRTALYLTGMDARNLPISGHWAQLGLWGLTLCAALFFLWRTRPLQGTDEPARSPLAAAGCLAAALAFFLSDFPDAAPGSLYTVELILRWGAGLSMIAVAFCRLTGRRPLFLFHGTVCLFLILRMISLYRLWSADPQLIDYGFYLGLPILSSALIVAYFHLLLIIMSFLLVKIKFLFSCIICSQFPHS